MSEVRNRMAHTVSAEHVDAAGRMAASIRRESATLMRAIGSIKLPEFLLFALMISDVVPIPHASEIFMSLLIVLAMFRRPKYELGSLQLLIPVFAVALTYIGLVSLALPAQPGAADWKFRLIRLCAVSVLVFVIGTGRIDARSGVIGVAVVALMNVPLFYAGMVRDFYGGYLTGFFGDKNFSGLVYAMVGILATGLFTRIPHKVIVYLVFAAPVWLSGSRTSMAAYVAAGIWMVVGSRIGTVGKVALGLLTYWIVDLTSEDYSRVGTFSDRLGSDLLRSRIDAASRIKVDEAGFWGEGLGNAFVHIQGRDWFFHNSYWSALVEGGWPWTVFLVGVTILVMFQPFRSRLLPRISLPLGAGAVIMVTASRLGEVFFTIPWAIGFGIALQSIVTARAVPGAEDVAPALEESGPPGGNSDHPVPGVRKVAEKRRGARNPC